MPLRLPPLNTLRIFEAAGRRRSFKNAAIELGVTPSAVSHGIQTLEDWLGTPLFHRGPRGLSLTSAGENFLPKVRESLSLIADAAEHVPGRKATGTLSVSVAPTFASRWLIPRLAKFRLQLPEISISLDTSRHYVEFPLDGYDLAIRMAPADRAGPDWIQLFHESLVPVCAPQLARAIKDASWPQVMQKVRLIHVSQASEDWDFWLGTQGFVALSDEGNLHIDTIHGSIEAAIEGLGMALGRRPLIDQDLAHGRLVSMGPELAASTSYWLVGLSEAFDRPEVKSFREWVAAELLPDTELRR